MHIQDCVRLKSRWVILLLASLVACGGKSVTPDLTVADAAVADQVDVGFPRRGGDAVLEGDMRAPEPDGRGTAESDAVVDVVGGEIVDLDWSSTDSNADLHPIADSADSAPTDFEMPDQDVGLVDVVDATVPDSVAIDSALDALEATDNMPVETTFGDSDLADVSLPACATDASACDDNDPCSNDACDLAIGCTHTIAADKQPCGTGLWCKGGGCVPAPACGNGVVEDDESCDDGNTQAGDGCSPGCVLEVPDDMVVVPAGAVWIGKRPGPPYDDGCSPALLQSDPGHYVWLSTFAIDRFEATQADYKACVAAGVCEPVAVPLSDPVTKALVGAGPAPPYYANGLQGPNLPMFNLKPLGAEQYCKWKGRRLPSEVEWEKAARGGCEYYESGQCANKARLFPWGNSKASCALAVIGCVNECAGSANKLVGCGSGLLPVGSKPLGASPYGVHDMAGGVAEWTQDWAEVYSEASLVNPVQLVPSKMCSLWFCLEQYRVLRGGSAVGPDYAHAVECRYGTDPNATTYPADQLWGVRCAKSLPSPKPPATFP